VYQNNLKQLGLAALSYNDTHGTLPPGGTFAPDGTMRHSWETHLLPYLSYVASNIDLDRPWNDPRNAKYFKGVLPVFINPGFRFPEVTDREGYGLSHYAANCHVLSGNRGMKLEDITDGTSTTLLFGEVNAGFKAWGHPVNWRDPARGINRGPDGFGGPRHSGGASFVMADGSVRFLNEHISPAVLRALSTPRGGEAVDAEALGGGR
jgi:prepilin-type processing-associated H-X9-DG protein